jgi:DNA-binding NtrC family response regulator
VTCSYRILVVEDDAALGELFAQVLGERGHRVQLATDVRSAKASLAREPFDVVITDLRLPGESGFDLLDWVRRQRLSARVIVASAFASGDVAAQAERLGAERVLSKPVEPSALVSAIEAAA